jgi:hypothetical protein
MQSVNFEALCEKYFGFLISEGFEPADIEERMHGMWHLKRYQRGNITLEISIEWEGYVDFILKISSTRLNIHSIIKRNIDIPKGAVNPLCFDEMFQFQAEYLRGGLQDLLDFAAARSAKRES